MLLRGIATNRQSRCMGAILMVVLALFMAGPAIPQPGPAAPNQAPLRFSVTDCWGNPIQTAVIHVISRGGTTAILHYPDERDASVPPGSYTVIAESPGFSKAAKFIQADRQPRTVSFCLTLDPIETTGGERGSSLSGSIAKKLVSELPASVRLEGVYTDFTATTPVDEKGSFSFADLQPGRYHLMFFSGGLLKKSRDVDVRPFETEVTIE
jgi:hypothetical protein